MRDIEKYSESYMVSDFEEYQVAYRRKKVLEIIHKYAPRKILDIGCGMDPLFQYIDGMYDYYCVVEPSSIFCNYAAQLAEGRNVTCLQGFFYPSEELADKRFDFIICSSLLHELEQPEEMLKGIFEVSDIDTVVHINVPNAKSIHRLLAMEMGLIPNEYELSDRNILYQQHSVYDLDMLKAIVEDNGFDVIEDGSYFVKPFTHHQMHQMLDSSIVNKDVLDGLYNIVKYIPEYGSEIFVNCRLRQKK
ncbi:MAG: class I SAM-dependent methyltransferase [Lachnospiraceae bacterium]|nr:class I SAM-dependent methyltransferase [Lachnospiraceae bacterium]